MSFPTAPHCPWCHIEHPHWEPLAEISEFAAAAFSQTNKFSWEGHLTVFPAGACHCASFLPVSSALGSSSLDGAVWEVCSLDVRAQSGHSPGNMCCAVKASPSDDEYKLVFLLFPWLFHLQRKECLQEVQQSLTCHVSPLPKSHSKSALLHPLSVIPTLMLYSCCAWNPLWGSFTALITLSNCLGAPVSPFRSTPGNSTISLLFHHSWMCRAMQLLIWIIKLMRFRDNFKEGSFFCLTQRTADVFRKGPLQYQFPWDSSCCLGLPSCPFQGLGGRGWLGTVKSGIVCLSLHRPLRLRRAQHLRWFPVQPPADAVTFVVVLLVLRCSRDVLIPYQVGWRVRVAGSDT